MTRSEKWACWWALCTGIEHTYDQIRIPKRATISAFRKLTEELGAPAWEWLDERIAYNRIHNTVAMYGLMDVKKEIVPA